MCLVLRVADWESGKGVRWTMDLKSKEVVGEDRGDDEAGS